MMRSTLPFSPTLASLALSGAFLLGLSGCATPEDPREDGPAAGDSRRPDVVLISIDCLNHRQTGTALAKYEVPALRELAADSLLFNRAYAHAPWTTPSHMSMLTGLYPSEHGRDLPWGLMIQLNRAVDREARHPNMAGILGEAGYATAGFVGRGSTSPRFGLGAGFEVYEDFAKDSENSDLEQVVGAFESWLGERGDEPIFAFLHTFDFHGPRPTERTSDPDTLAHIDLYLARIVAALKASGRYEDALVLFTADHGSRMLNEDKCCVHGAGHYEENLRVPLLLKLPEIHRRGRVFELARHIDLLPTVLDATGLEAEDYAGSGRSLLTLLDSPEKPGSVYSFSEADGRCARRFGLADDRFKYIYTPANVQQAMLREDERFFDSLCVERCADLPDAEELYDLEKDPREERNLLAAKKIRPEYQEALQRFRQAMLHHLNLPPQYRRRLLTTEVVAGEAPLDPKLEESLRSLGYI